MGLKVNPMEIRVGVQR
ncbi:hypothetical protein Goshw_005842 [Gossypium schwendimanii]|uniref:Uncharacterized protein n=2 Tax=Gossypium TaxID=3633 RepID=A0A7J9MRA9_GOSSC|nr:hypothetical protein [Gossypium schwendimanii]